MIKKLRQVRMGRLAKLEYDVKALREALRPFAEIGEMYGDSSLSKTWVDTDDLLRAAECYRETGNQEHGL